MEHACQRFQLPQLSSLLMCHLPLWRCHLLLLLHPSLRLVPLCSNFLYMVNAYVDHLTVTLIRLSSLLLFLSQLLIVMLFFIRNGSTRWLRRLLPLSELARGILCPVPHVFIRSLVSGYIRLRLTLMVLLSDISLALLLVVFSRSMVEIMMRLLLLLLI
jgi:hypothetical protein